MSDNNTYGNELLDFLGPERARLERLDPGGILVRQHERGSDVFVVVEGLLEASIDSGDTTAVVTTFEPGQLFGELTAISGGPRTATVSAASPSTVAIIDHDDFMEWLGADETRSSEVAARARLRIDQNRAAAMLALVLGSDNREILDRVLPMVRWRTLEPGEVLCEEGEPSGSAYLILSGRVEVTSKQRIGSRKRVELGRNQIVGELGVLDRLPRTATVTALRRTNLAELPAEAIDDIITTHPEVAVHLFRQALGRALHPEPRSDQAKAVTIIFTELSLRAAFMATASAELKRHGTVAVMDAAAVDSHLGHDRAAQSEPGSVGASRVDEVLHDVETTHDYLLMCGDPEPSPWSMRAAETADRTLIVSSAYPSGDELRLIAALEEKFANERLSWWRLVMHPQSTKNPANHHPAVATGKRILHGRVGNEADARRAVRLLSGNAVGLALGGGGARGFGHIGAYRAMLEAGIEPDVIAGTSIGSVYAIGVALDYTPEEMIAQTKNDFADLLDWTIPIVAFLKGERITESISDRFGRFDLQSMWRPVSTITTNLTHASVDVRTAGPADKAVRMSVSIPGVLPPISENGEVFVDGGVLNNLPADVVASDPSIREVFAIDVSPPVGPRVRDATDPSVSGISMLGHRARRRPIPYPSAASVVMQTMVAGSGRDRHALLDDGTIDHYIHLDIRGSSLLAFETVDPVVEQGYTSAKEWLTEKFPAGYKPCSAVDDRT